MTATPDEGFPRSIPAPALWALEASSYTDLAQLDGVPASQLKGLHGMGPKALRLIQEALQEQGMSLRQEGG